MLNKKVKRNPVCFYCHNPIDIKKIKYCQISTFNREISDDDHTYFHFDCWKEYFDGCVSKKVRETVAFMQDQALTLFNDPAIKGLLSQIQGIGTAMNMLKTPLREKDEKEIVLTKEDVKKRIQHDRGRKTKKRVSNN